jgi:NAD(P)-dependent dehydrogenase (short-subunit alcohol dehydrogenase family)
MNKTEGDIMYRELFDLSGRVALITGASKGLGKAIAHALAGAGADVALYSRSREDLQAVKASIEALGRRAEIFCVDVLDKQAIRDTVGATVESFGHIDILVNNAGVNVRKPVLELSSEEWDLVINTNLKGYLLMAQAVVPDMIERGHGKVINMASILGTVALPSQVAYASSKGGVIQMTKVMALEWAKQGVQVNAIGPTYFETPLVAQLRNDPERFNFIVERTPMGRWGQPDELAGVAIFLASRASDFITGQTVFIDGGWTIW